MGGASSNEGRVEVCVNGMWGTVSNYQWDSREATVVCKQLGYILIPIVVMSGCSVHTDSTLVKFLQCSIVLMNRCMCFLVSSVACNISYFSIYSV